MGAAKMMVIWAATAWYITRAKWQDAVEWAQDAFFEGRRKAYA